MDFFSNLIKTDHKKEIEGLTKNTIPLYLYNLYKQQNKGILFVTSSLYEANKTFNLLNSYSNDVLFFPVDEFLTTKLAIMSPEFKSIRLNTINELTKNSNKIVVTHTLGYLKYIESKKNNKSIKLKVENEYSRDTLINDLTDMGYCIDTLVTKTGEFAKRGYIIDVFPIGENDPIRIEFFDNIIESIRFFDSNTQLSIKELKEIVICSFNETEIKDLASIYDYMENPFVVFLDYNQVKNSAKSIKIECEEYNLRNNTNEKYMFDFNDISPKLEKFILKTDSSVIDDKSFINISDSKNYSGNIDLIKEDIEKNISCNNTVIICLNGDKQITNFSNYITDKFILTDEFNIKENKVNVIKKNLLGGFSYYNTIVLTSQDLYGYKENDIKYKSRYKYGTKIKNINNLNIGDYVVHRVHGIGVYNGIVTLVKSRYKKDYLKVCYKGSDILYIPVEKIDLISKYSGKEGVVPKIHKLGGTEWQKQKIKAKGRIESIAKDLLKLYALRQAQEGFAFNKDSEEQLLFEKEFTFTPTADQLIATKQIKEDMENKIPMDRLLCGDVGFGKTEVAFRAIFKAIISGKQVAYLCPTTILSNQHYKNAIDRFRSFPINIALLNRFVSNKKIKTTIEGLKLGKIDFVIGTHRLLSDDVVFKDLGLLIVDEEQRFGVKHKEKIKGLKNNVDVLTLSATPIPRTLQMSMSGIRNLSLIETAPMDRYPVQTYVLEENDDIIKDAVYKELGRNGQVFILYNNVGKISEKFVHLSKIIPEAKINYAHGQMSKIELENTMQDFIEKKFDVLICTTIIETGIDIPNANTLIILGADKFGLSQLYQIRGRVGRSNLIGYAYLMYKKDKILSEIAIKRLEAIKEFTELGSGFKIAMRDLSIRGAGDILGSEQAGFIDTVGIDLYLKMLNEEVEKLKGNIIEEEPTDEKPLIEVETHISDEYVSDEDLKIEIHNMINEIDSYQKLTEVRKELEDRFGKVTEEMLIYMYEEWLDKISKKIGIENYIQDNNNVEFIFNKEISSKIDGEKLFYHSHFINPNFKLNFKNEKIHVILKITNLNKHWIYYLIDLLSDFNQYIKKH